MPEHLQLDSSRIFQQREELRGNANTIEQKSTRDKIVSAIKLVQNGLFQRTVQKKVLEQGKMMFVPFSFFKKKCPTNEKMIFSQKTVQQNRAKTVSYTHMTLPTTNTQ